ncbi:MAG: hypothetical protein KDA84_23600, partial [Planctomycetaceae bacterium]|nr:hypothetical protein [Planctomycetaceae bacterium]
KNIKPQPQILGEFPMAEQAVTIVQRVNLLGITCDEVPSDRMTSAVAALSCFPMYMVANLHGWTSDTQWRMPLVDLPGFEAIREAFAIGRQEKHLDMDVEHRRLLGTLLGPVKPSDRVIYEYALETLQLFLQDASPDLADGIRAAVAKMVMAVAAASGDGLLGTGQKISREEEKAIQYIASILDLRQSKKAEEILKAL